MFFVLFFVCVCVWVGAGGQAKGHDGGLPSVQGDGSAELPWTEERPSWAKRRWEHPSQTFAPRCCPSLPSVTTWNDWCHPAPTGVDTDELDSNVDDWEEETIEFFINEEIIPLGDL